MAANGGTLLKWCGVLPLSLSLFGSLTGCEPESSQLCHSAMKVSQESLLKMDQKDRQQVEQALALVKTAASACKASGLQAEAKDTADAERSLTTLLEMHAERARKPKPRELSAEEIQKLIAKGDPSCPRGQGYKIGQSTAFIKCTGPTMLEMSRSQAKSALQADGMKILIDQDVLLKAEYGSESYVFEFPAGDEKAPASCLKVTMRPGIPWQETATRITGLLPNKLKLGLPIPAPSGPVEIGLEGAEPQQTVLFGKCKKRE